jgi:16S rRNA (cytosine967-C5)-methyltransferase
MSDPARRVAFGAILRVTEHGGYSNLALPGALRRAGLDAEQRAFATELTYGTLRRLLPLDRAIEQRSSRPMRRMTSGARAVLRLGAYQLLFLRVPAHAAVSESVSLAATHERGFVNAILRSLAADPPEPPTGPSAEDVAARTGLSAWAVDELRALVGDDAERAAAALGERARLSIRVNTCKATAADLLAAIRGVGFAAEPSSLHPDVLLLEGADPRGLPGFDEGLFAVQDQASAYVVAALDPHPGERVLDLCAGPGGKAAHIACLVGPDGSLVASDLHPRRAGLVARSAERLGVRARVLVHDAIRPALGGDFDRVLVDAPCSGLGSARRRPELLWRGSREELEALSQLQLAIASSGARLLAPGGTLVYSVCTFPGAETDQVCDALLAASPELEPVAIEGPDGVGERVRLWPHRHGSDAMFVAAFRRPA